MLTGDKVDTAKNIGYSCRLLSRVGMELLEYPVDAVDPFTITQLLDEEVAFVYAAN